jgi:histidine triad (HIT) family protein
MNDCLFCKMVNQTIPVARIYEDDHVIVIKDINPQAPCHLLAIPRTHYAGIHLVPQTDYPIFQHLTTAIQKVLLNEGIAGKGYRLVINSGSSAGQSVDHIHVHILSGRQLDWPPG